MNQTIVIYKSKYGFTKHYAHWIAQALSCPVYSRKEIRSSDLRQYDTVIYGGGLYAGGISGISFLTRNYALLKDKNVVLFTCGLADPADKNNVRHIREGLSKSLSPEMMDAFQIFHLRGGIDYSRLTLLHKTMMAMLRKSMLKKDPADLNEEARLMLDTYGKAVDFSDETSIAPLTDYVRLLSVK